MCACWYRSACQVSMKKPRGSVKTCGLMRYTPGRRVSYTFIAPSLLSEQVPQVLSITILEEGLRQSLQLRRINVAHAIGHLLNTGDLEPLPTLNSFNEIGGLQQRCMSAHIQPGYPPPQ